MMRVAAIAATEAGIEVCAPVHDAFLIAAPLERLDEDVAHMRKIMSHAGEAVCGLSSFSYGAKVKLDEPGRNMELPAGPPFCFPGISLLPYLRLGLRRRLG
jgi:hypothetical protein